MTVVSDRTYKVGDAAYVYFTFTNEDQVTTNNPYGLVDADPVNVTEIDPLGAITTGVAEHVSQGYYRYLVQFRVGGGNYLVHPAGSALGAAVEDVIIPVNRPSF